MSYARFTEFILAQEYADAVQAELARLSKAESDSTGERPKYIATRWSDVITGSDGAYYVNLHETFPPDTETVADVPQSQGAD